MDTAIVTTYCLIDDWLRCRRHKESPQRRVSDAEVMTTAIIAARFFGGNFENASDLLKTSTYFGQRLSRSQFNRRLHAVAWVFESLFDWLSLVHKTAHADQSDDAVFVIDSCPVAACDNIRIDRCRLYPKTTTTDAFRGYTHSKRRFFYGLKLHAITTAEGAFVEVSLTPGSYSDTKQLRQLHIDLPEGATLYADKAYGRVLHRRCLGRGGQYHALASAKEELYASRASLRGVPAADLPQAHRARLQPTRAARAGIDSCRHGPQIKLKVFLFVLACSIDALL